MAAENTVPLGLEDDLFVTIPHSDIGQIAKEINVDKVISAPFSKGNKFGEIRIKLDDRLLVTKDLIAQKTISEGNLWQRMTDSVMRYVYIKSNID